MTIKTDTKPALEPLVLYTDRQTHTVLVVKAWEKIHLGHETFPGTFLP